MHIKTYLNTTQKEVEEKKFNIWIGVSLGNKAFTPNLIREYITWSLKYTKSDVLIVVGDSLQAINLQFLNGYNRIRALKKALRDGDKKELQIQDIISTHFAKNIQKIKLVRYNHVIASKYHEYRLAVLNQAYRENIRFKSRILSILNENKKVSSKKLPPETIDCLAQYVLKEIPVYLNGAKYGGLPIHGGTTYTLQIYPGISLIDSLLMDLQSGNTFPELSKKLHITNKIAIVEGYPDTTEVRL